MIFSWLVSRLVGSVAPPLYARRPSEVSEPFALGKSMDLKQFMKYTKPSLAEIFLFPFPVIFVYKVFDTKYKLLYLVPSFHYLAALKW